MPLTDDGYDPRSDDDIRESEIDTANAVYDDPATNDGDLIYALLQATAKTLSENHENDLSNLYDAAYITTATDTDLDRRVKDIGINRRAAIKATGVVTFSRNTSASTDYTIQSGTKVQTEGSDPIQFVTTESVTLTSGTTSVQANIEASNGGVEGNVGANSIVVMPSNITGVETVTNSNPTGDDSYTDTNSDPYISGDDEETDDELRERAFDSTSIGGAATASSLGTALRKIADVKSVTVYQNKTDTDNTGTGGLPPTSFEAIVFGGTDQDVAEAIHTTKGVTAHDVGGVNGVDTTYTVTSETLNENETINFSRPNEVALDLTIDLVYTDNYGGKDMIRNRVVEYIGGTKVDGSSALGEGLGKDIYVDILEDTIVGDDTGVLGISNIDIDATGDGVDDTTTNANGLRIYDLASNEIGTANATDGSITVNETKG